MFPDVVDLRSFYAQPLGVVTRRLINRAIRARFDDVRGLAVLGMGYATPYLGVFREECERTLAFMPGAQGVTRWPSLPRRWPHWSTRPNCLCATAWSTASLRCTCWR